MIRLPAADDPAVSLIVLLDGAAEMGERCLRAIAAADDSVPCETVVLLNDPDPALEALVRNSTTGGRVILSRANSGPGVGWNLGAAIARAPRIATLHEDSEPEPGWLAPLCETMTETGAGAVGSRLYNHDGSVQNCGWVLFSDGGHMPINEANAPEVVAASEPTPADTLSGAAMLVDRDAVSAVGGWDERFHPAVFVDIDVSTAIWSQGRPLLSVPASRVRHHSGTFDRRENTALTGPGLRRFLFERHRGRFLEKWGPVMDERASAPGATDQESVRASVDAALSCTRQRAERVRSGSWEPSAAAGAERRLSGVQTPVVEGADDAYAVAAEVEEALGLAESELIAEYCAWLTREEAALAGRLVETQRVLRRREEEAGELHGHIAELRGQRDELAATLDRILGGRTWRLRTRVVNSLRRLGIKRKA